MVNLAMQQMKQGQTEVIFFFCKFESILYSHSLFPNMELWFLKFLLSVFFRFVLNVKYILSTM